jgi:PAS domain S-box-containing protein
MQKKKNKKSKAADDSPLKENKKNISHKIEKIADMKDMERVVLNSISELVLYQDTHNKILWANEAASASISIEPEELIGRYCYEVWHQRNETCKGCPVAKACKTGQAHSSEMTTPDGRSWLVRGYPVRNEKGIITGAVEITIEITERKQAEKSIQENEERLRRIIEGANAGYFFIDSEGRFQKVNQAWLRMHGYSDEKEVIGEHFSLTQIEKDLPKAEKNVKRLLGGKSIPFGEFTRRCKDGSTCFHIFSANPVVQGGKIVGFEGFLIDTTEYKQAERELKESEAKYSSLVEQAQDGVVIIQDGVFKFVNNTVAEISGYTVKELIGMPFINVIAPESKDLVSERHKARMAGEKVPSFYEAKLIGKEGAEKDLELTVRIIQYQGRPAAMAIARDITERKREEKIKSVLFNISEATSVSKNLDQLLKNIHQELGRIIDTTNFYIALYDEEKDLYTFPYYVDQYDDDFYPQQLKKSLTDYVRRTGKPVFADKHVHERLEKKGEIDLIGPDSSVWLGAPLRTAQGVIGVAVVQSYNDRSIYSQEDMDLLNFISGHIAIAIQRKQSEAALRESEEKFRSLAEQSPNMIFINKKGRIVYANKRCEDVLGFSRKKFYSPDFDFMTLHAEQSIEAIKSNFEKHLKGKEIEPLEITLVTKDGEEIEALLTSKLINYEGEMAILGIVTDITEHKKAQKALKKSEQLYRAVVEDQSELICRFLPDRTVTFVNEAYCRYFGKKPKELIGKSFLPLIFEKDRKKVDQEVNSLSRKNPVVNLEERIVMPNGSIRWMQWSNRAIFDDKNNIIEYQAVGRDITEQKEAEKRLQDSEIRFRRMAENIQSGLTIIENGKVIYLNKRATEIFGYPEEKLIDLNGFNLAAPEEKERLKKIEKEIQQKGEFPGELEFWIVR